LNLWKVDVDKSELNPGSTKEDIEKLGGVSMEFEYDFTSYFPKNYEPTRNKIHIVAAIIITSTGKCLLMFYLSNKKFILSYIIFFLFDQEQKNMMLMILSIIEFILAHLVLKVV
jgi:hypothetical protein